MVLQCSIVLCPSLSIFGGSCAQLSAEGYLWLRVLLCNRSLKCLQGLNLVEVGTGKLQLFLGASRSTFKLCLEALSVGGQRFEVVLVYGGLNVAWHQDLGQQRLYDA